MFGNRLRFAFHGPIRPDVVRSRREWLEERGGVVVDVLGREVDCLVTATGVGLNHLCPDATTIGIARLVDYDQDEQGFLRFLIMHTKRVERLPEGTLWVDKHSPRDGRSIVRNWGGAEQVRVWLAARNRLDGHRKALVVCGPPGVGKTTAIYLAAEELGYTVVEMNASDIRRKEDVESVFDSYGSASLFGNKKTLLLMEEIDGMLDDDKGGMPALVAKIAGCRLPVVCTCNDERSKKLETLLEPCDKAKKNDPVRKRCTIVRFSPLSQLDVARVLTMVAQREGLIGCDEPRDNTGHTARTITSIAEGCNGDMRNAIHSLQMVSTRLAPRKVAIISPAKSGIAKAIPPNDGKKDVVVNMFDAASMMWSPSASLSDKLDEFAHNAEMGLMMMQQNYATSALFVEDLAHAAERLSTADLMMYGSADAYMGGLCIQAAAGINRPTDLSFPDSMGARSKTSKNMRLLRDASSRYGMDRSLGDLALITKLILASGARNVTTTLDAHASCYGLGALDWDYMQTIGMVVDAPGDGGMGEKPKRKRKRMESKAKKASIARMFASHAGVVPE